MAFDRGDVRWTREGIVLTLRSAKTDQEGQQERDIMQQTQL